MRSLSEITIKEVDTAIRVLAAESPDYVYNPTRAGTGCFYEKGVRGGPESKGCIFGQAFQMLGVDMSTVGGDDITNVWYETHNDAAFVVAHCPEGWAGVQHAQDNGSTWGKAIQKLMPIEETEPTPA